MAIWRRNKLVILESNRALNIAAMHNAGFAPDPGRKLTKAEIDGLQLTPPNQIRDCRAENPYHWR